mmetsp:Transcript_3338/g.9448  ORF Transcript_3338/g.9448 Transcript_3338/m.9448 type:complete len:251 (+) Transcript_3338:644-1396(+)
MHWGIGQRLAAARRDDRDAERDLGHEVRPRRRVDGHVHGGLVLGHEALRAIHREPKGANRDWVLGERRTPLEVDGQGHACRVQRGGGDFGELRLGNLHKDKARRPLRRNDAGAQAQASVEHLDPGFPILEDGLVVARKCETSWQVLGRHDLAGQQPPEEVGQALGTQRGCRLLLNCIGDQLVHRVAGLEDHRRLHQRARADVEVQGFPPAVPGSFVVLGILLQRRGDRQQELHQVPPVRLRRGQDQGLPA